MHQLLSTMLGVYDTLGAGETVLFEPFLQLLCCTL